MAVNLADKILFSLKRTFCYNKVTVNNITKRFLKYIGLAYYVSVSKGLDVDKPRNLAKSVTVE